jgi:hypothetical protein
MQEFVGLGSVSVDFNITYKINLRSGGTISWFYIGPGFHNLPPLDAEFLREIMQACENYDLNIVEGKEILAREPEGRIKESNDLYR